MQKLQVIGHIGRDAVVRETNGRKVINFSLAVNDSFKNAEGVKVERTAWYDVSIWRNSGESVEISKYLLKGTMVHVEGKPSISLYLEKEGKQAANITISANIGGVILLASKKGNESESETKTETKTEPSKMPAEFDDFKGPGFDDFFSK